jgi:uncharacterized protein (DUF952 family)
VIYHIAEQAAWDNAKGDGVYAMSTLGKSLEDEGFIHCSTAAQVARVANAFYRGRDDLVLLTIDPTLVGVPMVLENREGGSELFPHLYGSLAIAAVVGTEPLVPAADGSFDSVP